MAQFESIEPTPLLLRIRSGEEDRQSYPAVRARNNALSLQFTLQNLIEASLDSRSDTVELSSEERAEIAITGLQLAFERSIDYIDSHTKQPERA